MNLEDTTQLILEVEEERSGNSEENQEKQIKRRLRVGKKYHHIKNTNRKQLISRVESKGEKIIDVARELGMKYSTAKSILKVYRSEGRTNKIPKSQRYLSLRAPDPDDFRPAPKAQIRKTKKNTSSVKENSSSYAGPVTRLRFSNRNQKETFKEKVLVKSEPAETIITNYEEEKESKEPAPRKKVAKEIITKVEAHRMELKQEASTLEESIPKKEEPFKLPFKAKDEEDVQKKTVSHESSHEVSEAQNVSQTDPSQALSDMLRSALGHPSINPLLLNSYYTDLAQIRIQNMAMYFQSLRLQGFLLNGNTINSHQKRHPS